MCGRFTQRFSWQELHEYLDLSGPPLNLAPRYNLAPSQEAAIVRVDGETHTLSMLRWGLVPAWSRDAKIGYKLINARSETASAKPSFRSAYRSRRCLVPCDGYYEWTRRGAERQAWLIEPDDGGIVMLAGLWERWIAREDIAAPKSLAHLKAGDPLETFTILTRAAAGEAATIHHRMPVMVPHGKTRNWLQPETPAPDSLPPPPLRVTPVSKHVNRPSNDDPICVEPVPLRPRNPYGS